MEHEKLCNQAMVTEINMIRYKIRNDNFQKTENHAEQQFSIGLAWNARPKSYVSVSLSYDGFMKPMVLTSSTYLEDRAVLGSSLLSYFFHSFANRQTCLKNKTKPFIFFHCNTVLVNV